MDKDDGSGSEVSKVESPIKNGEFSIKIPISVMNLAPSFLNAISRDQNTLRVFLAFFLSGFFATIMIIGQLPFVAPAVIVDTPGRIAGGIFAGLSTLYLFIISFGDYKKTNEYQSLDVSIPKYDKNNSPPHDVNNKNVMEEISPRIVSVIKEFHKDGAEAEPLVLYRQFWRAKLIRDNDYEDLTKHLLNTPEKTDHSIKP